MENPARTQDREANLSPTNTTRNSNVTSTTSANETDTGASGSMEILPRTLTLKPIPYSPSIVQTDKSNFKQVVQILTGCPDTVKYNTASSSKTRIPHRIPVLQKNKQKEGFKIYERRNRFNNNPLIVNTRAPTFTGRGSSSNKHEGFSPSQARDILSPSMLDFPKLALSPDTQLKHGDVFRCSSSSSYEEEKAIAEKGFYLHTSPMNTPRGANPPKLLQLFPMTSPKFENKQNQD